MKVSVVTMTITGLYKGLPVTAENGGSKQWRIRQFITKAVMPANHVACLTADNISLVSGFVFISHTLTSVASSMRCEEVIIYPQ